MEFMMIRAVKNGASVSSGNELPKGSLGIISTSNSTTPTTNSFHSNLYQQHNLGLGQPVTVTSQQLGGTQVPGTTVGLLTHQSHHSEIVSNVDFTQNNAFGGLKFYATPNSVNANNTGENINWTIDNNVLFPGTNSFDVFATQSTDSAVPPTSQVSRKNQSKLLPVVIKDKDVLDRIRIGNNSHPDTMQGLSQNNSSYRCSPGVFSSTTSSNQCSSASHNQSNHDRSFRKMSHRLWEASCSNASSESVIKSRGKHKSPEEFRAHLTKILSTSKRSKLDRRPDGFCQTPNLLKTIHCKSTSDKQSKSRSLGADGKLLMNPNSSSAPSQSGLPTENLFLKLYDPIKLLRRLRLASPRSEGSVAAIVKSLVSSKKKVQTPTGDDFPTCAKPAPSTYVTKIPTWKKVRRKKYLKNADHHRLPKYSYPERKVHVNYRSSHTVGSVITDTKLRVIAAVYLKRAVMRLRGQDKISASVLKRRLRKIRDNKKNRRKVETCGTSNRLSYVRQFSYMGKQYTQTVLKLPPSLLVDSQKVILKESPVMLHTLELLRHKRELQDRLEAFEADGTVQKVGSLPEKLDEEGATPLDGVLLNRRQVKHVISQKLLINLANVGFTNTKLRPLEVLADATANFFAKMAQRLKDVSEVEMYGVDHGFPDAMERVLIETGYGGVRGMEEFNRTKLVEYGQRMEEQCLHLRRQYAYKVRSKVGMVSSLNSTTTNSNVPAPSSSSTSTINVPSSSILTGNNISSPVALPQPTVMVVSGSGGVTSGATTTATGAVPNKATLMAKPSSMPSQPMSPGNSVLAEMLSSQEEHPARTPQGCPPSPLLGALVGTGGTADRQLEELMGAPPPNVEIRPNSFPHPHHLHQSPRQTAVVQQQQQQQQQVPLHQLLASLSQQQQSPQSRQQQPLLPPPSPQQQALNTYVNSLYASSPPLTPPTPPQHANQKIYQQAPQLQQTLQQGSQGQSQTQQSHLTQLLQRPITSQHSPNTNSVPTSQQQHHLIVHHHHPQPVHQQTAISKTSQYPHPPPHPSGLTAPSQQNPPRNVALIANTSNHSTSPGLSNLPGSAQAQASRQLGSTPPQLKTSKVPSQASSLSTGEVAFSSNTATIPTLQLARTLATANGTPVSSNNLQPAGKLITIIRSSTSGTTHQQGILVNSNHQHTQQESSVSLDNSIVSINLGSNTDMESSGDMVANSVAVNSTAVSKAKLKETISQRNLLRLNFEQVPSAAGDSTVLLSSSSVSAPAVPLSSANNVSNSNAVQYIGKVSDPSAPGRGQTVTWNNANAFS